MTKERSILFSAPMVKAILSGRKTQTRRAVGVNKKQLVDLQEPWAQNIRVTDEGIQCNWRGGIYSLRVRCPYGKPGDILCIKEAAWMWCEKRPIGITKTGRPKWHYVPMEAAPIYYCADHPDKPSVAVVSPETGNQWLWRKKIGRFLPRWAVRLRVVIKDVRVERLKDISAEDCIKEGLETHLNGPAAVCALQWSWKELWITINGADSWEANPWVWVISFAKVNP